ncbi:FAS-associated death domain protein [Thalassophryne amazonica]|uniref:FAS-associated death domain protein n=1 Tax=Thalassophryne amazonica TaxID=390379 RepID=UPI0014714E2F|nr:FAS-associated death domain protein [Thalassophryne amazonica]
MSSLHFNAVLLNISKELTAEQLEQLKFLCKDIIGKREREKVVSGLQLFQLLTERRQLGEDNTLYLSKLLLEIHRHDLSEILNGHRSQRQTAENQPDPAERVKLDIATDVIASRLGKNWRRLGRKLGVNDVKLESISLKFPTDLEEMTRELLKEWIKSRGADACTGELIKALRCCDFNLIADHVDEALEAPDH